MALKSYKAITPSLRQLVIVDRSGLLEGQAGEGADPAASRRGGVRNNHGRITAQHRGGGHKRRLRRVDFKRRKFDVAATVERLEYDPNRSGFIALIKYTDGELAYILAPQRLKGGRPGRVGRARRHQAGQCHAAGQHAVGTIVLTSS